MSTEEHRNGLISHTHPSRSTLAKRTLGVRKGEEWDVDTLSAIDHEIVTAFIQAIRISKGSEVTVTHRLDVLKRLAAFLGGPLRHAAAEDLEKFQATFAHLSPATVNVYSRHVQAFYSWAHAVGKLPMDPSASLAVPRVRRGQPHPTSQDQLRDIFACVRGPLRTTYVLAAFAGLRCGEVTRLRAQDLDMHSARPTALIHGKGNRERIVPLLPPVVSELQGLPRKGWLVTRPGGGPYSPERLSSTSSTYLSELGVETTLHSMRHSFATMVARFTRDPLLVRDLLGHASVATTEVYMQTSVNDAHDRLTEFNDQAVALLRPNLRLVGS